MSSYPNSGASWDAVGPAGYGTGGPAGYGTGGPAGYPGYDVGWQGESGYGKGDAGWGVGGYPPPGYDPYGKGGYGGGYPGYPPSNGGYGVGWAGPPPGYGGCDPWSKGAYDGYGCGKGGGGALGPDMWGKGGFEPRKRSRTRSPLPYRGELTGPLKEAQPGAPLERHAGAQRDNRPAWMTKGVGVGTELFGETKGDMVKPGISRDEMEAIQKRAPEGPDPFGDVFNERAAPAVATAEGQLQTSEPPKRAPLPDQSAVVPGAAAVRAPLPDQSSLFPGPGQASAPAGSLLDQVRAAAAAKNGDVKVPN